MVELYFSPIYDISSQNAVQLNDLKKRKLRHDRVIRKAFVTYEQIASTTANYWTKIARPEKSCKDNVGDAIAAYQLQSGSYQIAA